MHHLTRFIAVLLLIASPAWAAPKSPPPPSSPPTAAATKGIAAGYGWELLPDAELDRRLDECARLGARWIRFDVPWTDIQASGAGQWDWTRPDNIIARILARGMKPLPILITTPSWARPAPTDPFLTPPSNPSTYASFVSEFVKRYPDVDTIEIWNEPNLVFFWRSGPNATQYGQLLQGAYQAVKTVRASITVVSGGLAPAATTDGNISAYDFVSTLYAGGYNAFFEALGMHPYTYPNALPGETQPWNGWYQMVTQVRPTMQTYGDSVKKIWITEFGAPTGGTPGTYLTEQQQVQQMQSAYSNAQSYSWAGPLLWYSFKDFDTSDKTDRENHFGIVNSNWTKKPAFDTFRQLP